jgi:hydrogenase/urease accessory protein HupE
MKRLGTLAAMAMLLAEAAAHDARPLALDIAAISSTQYRLQMKVPDSVTTDNRPNLEFPDDCEAQAAQLWSCEQPLLGRDIKIRYPQFNPALSTLIRFSDRELAPVATVLAPDVLQWTVPARRSRWEVANEYFEHGVMHILKGFDHLLFVLALLLIARDTRRVLMAVTGFTLAHSTTLSLASMGWVSIPIAPTEAVIALSLLFLAREVMFPDSPTLLRRYPIWVAAAFGLLHGLGFASALGEVGLPVNELVAALLAFNVGVEVGQLAFVLVVVATYWLLNEFTENQRGQALVEEPRVLKVSAYLLGIPAAFWLFARL